MSDHNDIRIGKNVIKDDVLTPEPFFVFDYSGKSPSKAMREVGGIIEDMYGGKALSNHTKDLKWNPSETGISFFGLWTIEVKIFDSYSTLYYDVRVAGKEDKSTKEGDVSIVIYPYIITNIEVKSNLQKAYYKMWAMVFHNKKRVQNIDTARQHVGQIKKNLVEKYGIGINI